MSTTITTDVWCDSCGNWEEGFSDVKPTRAKSRKKVRAMGWTSVGEKDYCPVCSDTIRSRNTSIEQ